MGVAGFPGEFGMGIQDSSLGNLSGGSGFAVIHRDAIFPS